MPQMNNNNPCGITYFSVKIKGIETKGLVRIFIYVTTYRVTLMTPVLI
jgi:hypothetical protein